MNAYLKKTHKNHIRTYMRTIRHNLTYSERYIASQLITNKIISSTYIKKSKNIALFLSFDKEISTSLLIHILLDMNKNIYLPIISNTNSQHLLFAKYTFTTPLIINQFNIYEPQYDISSIVDINMLDIIFIPIVAFDNYGNRLGLGKGCYDKTLKQYKQNNTKYTPMGLAYDFQKIAEPSLPIEKWDIALPIIITPSHIWTWNF